MKFNFAEKFLTADTYGKVNQMKLSHANMLVSINALLTALNGDGEDSMRTGAVFIHVCGTDRPWTQWNNREKCHIMTHIGKVESKCLKLIC